MYIVRLTLTFLFFKLFLYLGNRCLVFLQTVKKDREWIQNEITDNKVSKGQTLDFAECSSW